MKTLAALKAYSLWVLAFMIPLLTLLVPNAYSRIFMMSLVYPLVLSFLARTGRFWVSHIVLLLSAVITFIYLFLLVKFNKTVKDSLDKVESDPKVSGTVLASSLIVFGIVLFLCSSFMDLYGHDVLINNGNGNTEF